VGLELSSCGDVSPLDRFFVATSPFFCRAGSAGQAEGLAGDETNEWKNRELPILRQDTAKGVMEQTEAFNPRRYQMPQVWRAKVVERWEKTDASIEGAALLMQSLRVSFLTVLVRFSLHSSFFFFLNRTERET